ncbi:energy transducer TonB [Arenimonas fontis]|uniref:Protein TonB n=1 Tax=Arenimonas fontis TaxID=2608255 RepID=A0A5B2Z9T6_9GAMM|nr:energy transducer TonB [Arenimonas fontis]KAA2284030.1 energy transducer TonB [Arenimonas fontis]
MTASAASASSLRWTLALALALGLAACSTDEPSEPAATTGAEAPAPAEPAGPSAEQIAAEQAAAEAEAALAALSVEELRERGGQALREQRLYAPAGDNAMEYYLALRKRSDKPDASAESALIDLMPYAIIAAEQAIGREDFTEAERLRALIERTDPQAPALPRIRDSIAKGQAAVVERAAQEAAREAQRQREQELAAQRAAEEAARAAAAQPEQPATPAPQPATPAPATPAPTTPTPAQPTAQTPAEPTRPRRTTPIPVRTPQPAYPRAAYRSRESGEVTVEIVIATDGSVADVRIVAAQPRGVFDREVLQTVRDWRFEPLDEQVTISRTFVFRP